MDGFTLGEVLMTAIADLREKAKWLGLQMTFLLLLLPFAARAQQGSSTTEASSRLRLARTEDSKGGRAPVHR